MLVGQIWAKLLLARANLTALTDAGLPKSLCLDAKSNALCIGRLLIVFLCNQYELCGCRFGMVNLTNAANAASEASEASEANEASEAKFISLPGKRKPAGGSADFFSK